MNNAFDCKSLFTLSDFFAQKVFEGITYPWEILSLLKGIIESIVNGGSGGFELYCPGVLIGKGVKIDKSARIEGPAVICDACEIRHSAYLRGSVILGEGCVIGNSSEIKNSVLLEGAQVPHYNYVGDSVLGKRAHLGAGAICSNLRLDKQHVTLKSNTLCLKTGLRKLGAILGDDVEIGCGAILCPGTVIGKNTTVYPLTVARGIYPEGSIIKDTSTVVKKEALPN